MFYRIALAALLIACLAHSANAQKDKPKLTGTLTWETVAADKAGKMTTKRAHVPNGWLILVQSGDDMVLTFVPDADHRWDDKSPSDAKPPKPNFDDLTKAAAEKLKLDLEQARARALAERDTAVAAQKQADEAIKRLQAELEKAKKEAGDNLDLAKRNEAEALKQKALAEAQRKEAQAVQKKAEDELKKALDQLEKAKKANKPKKGDKGDQATDAGKEALSLRKRIAGALGLAARDESQKAKATAEQARANEAAARQEALQLKDKLEVVAQQFQKQLAEATKALEEARTAEKRTAVEAAAAMEDNRRLKTETDLLKKENDRLRQLLDKKKK